MLITLREAATWVGIIMHITGMIIMHMEVACMGERFLSAGVYQEMEMWDRIS